MTTTQHAIYCRACGDPIRRAPGKSWPQHAKRKYCSIACRTEGLRGHGHAQPAPSSGYRLGAQMRPVNVDLTWQTSAACRRIGVDRELFFHPDGDSGPGHTRRREARAVAVCAGCPVLAVCRAHALTTPEAYGVWGGMTEAERRALRARTR